MVRVVACVLVVAGCGRIGFGRLDISDGHVADAAMMPCVSGTEIVPMDAFDASVGPPSSACNIGNVLALDGAMVGLDRVASDTCHGMWDPGNGSCGCVGIDLGSTQPIGLVEVWAMPVTQACNDPCGAGLCGTGDTMSLLVGDSLGSYSFVGEMSIGALLSRYAFTPQAAIASARYVVVCRQGQSSDRDDIAVDHVSVSCR